MKRILSMILVLALLISALALVSCGEKNLKLGLGVVISGAKGTNATAAVVDDPATAEDETKAAKDGSASVDVTAAAVLVDEDGKIVKVVIDTMQNKGSYKTDGTANAAGEFKTKLEKGDAYGMAKGDKLEWYEQIDVLAGFIVGKTIDEVKALVVDGYGTDDVKAAGCTISISGYIQAVEKAVANAAVSTATESSKLDLGMVTSQTNKNAVAAVADDPATEENETKAAKNGSIEFNTSIFATATDADGKVVATDSDVAQVSFAFTVEGASAFDATKEIKTKREKGDAYGMSAINKAEWYVQADALESVCIGKTATEIKGLAVNGYGTEDVKSAGCTIAVADLVAAAAKSAE